MHLGFLHSLFLSSAVQPITDPSLDTIASQKKAEEVAVKCEKLAAICKIAAVVFAALIGVNGVRSLSKLEPLLLSFKIAVVSAIFFSVLSEGLKRKAQSLNPKVPTPPANYPTSELKLSSENGDNEKKAVDEKTLEQRKSPLDELVSRGEGKVKVSEEADEVSEEAVSDYEEDPKAPSSGRSQSPLTPRSDDGTTDASVSEEEDKENSFPVNYPNSNQQSSSIPETPRNIQKKEPGIRTILKKDRVTPLATLNPNLNNSTDTTIDKRPVNRVLLSEFNQAPV